MDCCATKIIEVGPYFENILFVFDCVRNKISYNNKIFLILKKKKLRIIDGYFIVQEGVRVLANYEYILSKYSSA